MFITPTVGSESFSITYENGRVVRHFPESSRPVIGLALSGGGARGIAHIGVIEVLEENGIRVERIAGTSMGSIIGGLYAAGYSASALENIATNIEWEKIFTSAPIRRSSYIGEKETSQWPLFELRFKGFKAQLPSSLLSGQGLISILSWLTLGATYECGRDFDKLPIPFRSVTTDLKSGSKITIGEGNLGRAMQASSTIPLLFSPVEWEEKLLVDGGLKDNIPIGTVREMGSDFVIAVVIEESMHQSVELDNPLNIANQSTSIMMQNVTKLSIQNADFVISPNMDDFSSRNFDRIPEMIEKGRQTTLALLPALMDSLNEKNSCYQKKLINNISVSPQKHSEFVVHILSKKITTGAETSSRDIAKAMDMLWLTGRYYKIFADLDEKTGTLNIELTETPGSVIVHINDQNFKEIRADSLDIRRTKNGHFRVQDIITNVDSLLYVIRTEGYSFARITDVQTGNTPERLAINITVPKLTRISLDHGLKSRDSIIMREFEIKTGERFDMKKVLNSVENLYGTNLFEWVYVDVEPYHGGVGLKLHLREKNWSVVRFGLRFDETFNTEGRITLTRENILGFGNELSFTGQTGQRTKLLMLENKNNRVYKSLYTFSLKAYRQYWKRPIYSNHSHLLDYEDERYGTIVSVGQQMDKLGNAMLQFKSETVRTHFASFSKRKNTKQELRSIVIRSLIDSYDRYPFPKNGYVNVIYIENASEVLGGTEHFVKIYWGNAFAKTYAKKHTLCGSFIVGTADPSTPDIESFTLGGDASRLNFYDIDSAGSHFYADFPGLADEEIFGTRMAVGKLSYRLFIPRAFYLDLIYGIGNVWDSGTTINVQSLIQSYGITGSFSTFAGPLSIGWGITSEGDDRTYISAGWEF